MNVFTFYLNSLVSDQCLQNNIFKNQNNEDRGSLSTGSEDTVSYTPHILGSNQVTLTSLPNYEIVNCQTKLIRSSWIIILGQLQKVGLQCIVDLFELHPFVKEHFQKVLSDHDKVRGVDEDLVLDLDYLLGSC